MSERRYEGVPWVVHGFIHRGPDFAQGFAGWKVHAQEKPGIDVPVTVCVGHLREKILSIMEERDE